MIFDGFLRWLTEYAETRALINEIRACGGAVQWKKLHGVMGQYGASHNELMRSSDSLHFDLAQLERSLWDSEVER